MHRRFSLRRVRLSLITLPANSQGCLSLIRHPPRRLSLGLTIRRQSDSPSLLTGFQLPSLTAISLASRAPGFEDVLPAEVSPDAVTVKLDEQSPHWSRHRPAPTRCRCPSRSDRWSGPAAV